MKNDKTNSSCNTKFEIVVYKFYVFVGAVADYEPIYHYFGDDLTTLAKKVHDELKVVDWDIDDFIDAVHQSWHNNNWTVFESECIKSHTSLEVKMNH